MSKKRSAGIIAGLLVAGFCPLLASGQSKPASDKPSSSSSASIQEQSQQTPGTPVEANGTDKPAPAGTSKDRLFYALPNFLSLENTGKLPPLSTKQKFAVVARGSFDYIEYPWYAFLSAINQADDAEPAYGQGWGAYGKRYATSFADGTIENFLTSAILPSLLHQDPRFYQSEKGGFVHKAGYAVSRIFLTRSDSGTTQFNYSEVLGSALSAAVSTYSYHPRSTVLSSPTGPRFIGSDRTLTNTASVWSTQLGYDTITIVVREFWPDIHRKLSHKAKNGAAH
ncbi:MAG TPA: hypothetical protein VJQ54_13350 [Candidatus Sulfotelmatobacter sp.]|nr:hypothetical protein [Candidatus Sulfotelmatobacter sp.]